MVVTPDLESSKKKSKLVMSCSRLLSFVSINEESMHKSSTNGTSDHSSKSCFPIVNLAQVLSRGKAYCESDSLGPPDKNENESEAVNGSIYLALARTGRICCYQIMSWDQKEPVQTEPIVLWKTTATSGNNKDEMDDEESESDDFSNQEEEKDIEEHITCSTILTNPSISLDNVDDSDDSSSMIKACVVLGTNRSRVLAIEICINLNENEIASTNVMASESYYEPLPFIFPRPSSDNDLSEMHEEDNITNLNLNSIEENPNTPNDKEQFYTFHPTGGVSSIFLFLKPKSSCVHVWVSYKDGTAVQLKDRDFFSSILSDSHGDNGPRHPNTRVTIQIPHLAQSLPLPIPHTSILAPIPFTPPTVGRYKKKELSHLVFQALSYGGDNEYDNSHDPSKGGASLSFYSSEDHSSRDPTQNESGSEIANIIGGYVVDGTKSIVSGVSSVTSSVYSAMKWGWRRNNKIDLETPIESHDHETKVKADHPNEAFLTKVAPQHISPTTTMVDPPRRITSVSVDPNGKIAAVGDTLGRVLLMDLKSKQIIRMWKGLRESQCYWIQQYHPFDKSGYEGSGKIQMKKRQLVLYLVVHAKQRNILEVWRMKHGSRVKIVGVEPNATVLQCWETNEYDSRKVLSKCFILHRDRHFFEPLVIDDKYLSLHKSPALTNTSFISSLQNNTRANVLNNSSVHLKLLQQMLASDTNVPSDPQAVFSALSKISSMSDLSKALDLLAVSNYIEDEMGVQGSSFHTKAVEYCQNFLHDIERQEGNEGIVYENEHAIDLRKKIEYHFLVVQTYDILNRYETGMQNDDNNGNDDDNYSLAPRTTWSVEAIKWVETYDVIHDIPPVESLFESGRDKGFMRFSSFSKACTVAKVDKEERLRVQFCDSTKDRSAALLHVFHPFLQDIFVYNVVNSIFDKMGISDDVEKLLKYFGEWFISLPAEESAKASLFGTWCPILRWLQEIVVKSSGEQSKHVRDTPFLQPLLTLCMKAKDLPKAFLLAAVSREAVWLATRQQEAKTYGKVSCEEAVKPWDELLRKLRVCLLISFRLLEVNTGQFPINPYNVEDGEIFSVYEWLAQDEIMMSHKQDEIASMELSCRSSMKAFHPFHSNGDSPSKWKLLQSDCIGYANKTIPRSSKSDNHEGGPLLLYFSDHIHPVKLAAHRALILSGKWGRKPGSLHLLKDAVNALRALKYGEETNTLLVCAVRIEVWQMYIRPVFRALLFGFEDIDELSEDVWTPLCVDGNWIRGFAKVAGEILELIEYSEKMIIDFNEFDTIAIDSDEAVESTEIWPPLQKDIRLENLITRNVTSRLSSVCLNALQEHRSIVGAVHLVANDLSILDPCIPEDSEIFLQNSLFSSEPFPSAGIEEKHDFLSAVLDQKALSFTGHAVNFVSLGEVEHLSKTWGIPLDEVRSRFLLALYKTGKDAGIDLPTSNFQHIDPQIFIEGAFDIICVRLNATLETLKKTKQLRSLIGALDADTCEWVRNHAEPLGPLTKEITSNNGGKLPSLSTTHDLVLKVLQMSSTITDTKSVHQAHSLSILTGTLLKEMEDIE